VFDAMPLGAHTLSFGANDRNGNAWTQSWHFRKLNTGSGSVLAARMAVEDAGGSFTPDAARLGDITAQMHLALADARGAELTAQPITAALLAEWANEMIGDLDALIVGDAEARARHRASREHPAVVAVRACSPTFARRS